MKSTSKRSARPEQRDPKRRPGARRYSACPVCSSLVAEGWMESHVNLCLDTRQGKAAPCSESTNCSTSFEDTTPLDKCDRAPPVAAPVRGISTNMATPPPGTADSDSPRDSLPREGSTSSGQAKDQGVPAGAAGVGHPPRSRGPGHVESQDGEAGARRLAETAKACGKHALRGLQPLQVPVAGSWSQAEPLAAVPGNGGAAGSCHAAAAVAGPLPLSPAGTPDMAQQQLPCTAGTAAVRGCAAPSVAQAGEASLAMEGGSSREDMDKRMPCSALAVGEGLGQGRAGRREPLHGLPVPGGAPETGRQVGAPCAGSELHGASGDSSTAREGRRQQRAEDSRASSTVPLARASLAQRPAQPAPAGAILADVAGASSQLRGGDAAGEEGAGGALPPAPFNFLQPDDALVQPRLWALGGVRSLTRGAGPVQRTLVLQSGLVLMRQRLSLKEQQSLVEHTQRITRLFRRPRTKGGGQYHIYCAGWGPRWHPSSLRFVGPAPAGMDASPSPGGGGGRYSSTECVLLPASLASLGSRLAQEAHSHSPVFRTQPRCQPPQAGRGTQGEGGACGLVQGHQGAKEEGGGDLVVGGPSCRGEEEECPVFEPNICNVNFYPAKAQELGRIALGGHQDLDDTYMMPVVSASVGDSMCFFFRPLPPLHRRKSGVLVRIDDPAADAASSLGDASHNQERSVILNSGDVLVFGGKSRLVYHGTRDLQPGSRPKGLRMCSGRLNFTFRQHDPPGFVPPSHRHSALRS